MSVTRGEEKGTCTPPISDIGPGAGDRLTRVKDLQQSEHLTLVLESSAEYSVHTTINPLFRSLPLIIAIIINDLHTGAQRLLSQLVLV